MNKEKILKELERVKWFLWPGNVFRADETLTDLMFDVDSAWMRIARHGGLPTWY
jgi:hypothetical protein